MTQAFLTQTDFTAGELDPRLLGRTDLQSYQSGAAKLRNVVVETTGGVRRRPGMAYVATAEGPGRLVAFETGPASAFLLAFSDFQVDVYLDGVLQATVATLWSEAQVTQIAWAQSGESLLITHPDVPPQRLARVSDTVWTMGQWQFVEIGSPAVTSAPFARFASPEVAMQATATTGTVTLTTSAPVFIAEHLGGIVRLNGKQVELTNIQTPTQAVGLVLQALGDTNPTKDWDELAFSDARGWPVTVSFHQDRMVIGGSRDLSNAIWLSKTSDHFNFDVGTGLPDEAIAFRLAANNDPAIRSLVSGRHLQVFTSVGEWVITGSPLTPTDIQAQQQSTIGSPRDRQVPPRDVDGATLFAARSGREIREFLFVDTEQAYQAGDLALLARHLVQDPVDQDFDQARRLFLIAMADGSLASIAIYRIADIAAWSRHETDGRVLSVAVAGGKAFLLVERANGVFIEQLDDQLMVDSGAPAEPARPDPGLGRTRPPGGPDRRTDRRRPRGRADGGRGRGGHADQCRAQPGRRPALRARDRAAARGVRIGTRAGAGLSAGPDHAPPVRDPEPAHRYRRRAARGRPAHGGRRSHRSEPKPLHRRPLAAGAGLAAGRRAAALAHRAGHAFALRASLCNHRSEGEQLMGALSSLASIGLNLALAQQASERQARDVNAERDRQIQAIRQRDEEQQRQQEDTLRRQLAAQRARAGAAGVSGGSSANAVLRGLTEEATAAEQARAAGSNQPHRRHPAQRQQLAQSQPARSGGRRDRQQPLSPRPEHGPPPLAARPVTRSR